MAAVALIFIGARSSSNGLFPYFHRMFVLCQAQLPQGLQLLRVVLQRVLVLQHGGHGELEALLAVLLPQLHQPLVGVYAAGELGPDAVKRRFRVLGGSQKDLSRLPAPQRDDPHLRAAVLPLLRQGFFLRFIHIVLLLLVVRFFPRPFAGRWPRSGPPPKCWRAASSPRTRPPGPGCRRSPGSWRWGKCPPPWPRRCCRWS